jgi:hypothetical protein
VVHDKLSSSLFAAFFRRRARDARAQDTDTTHAQRFAFAVAVVFHQVIDLDGPPGPVGHSKRSAGQKDRCARTVAGPLGPRPARQSFNTWAGGVLGTAAGGALGLGLRPLVRELEITFTSVVGLSSITEKNSNRGKTNAVEHILRC